LVLQLFLMLNKVGLVNTMWGVILPSLVNPFGTIRSEGATESMSERLSCLAHQSLEVYDPCALKIQIERIWAKPLSPLRRR
jgi:hypothetical protein